MRNELNRLLVLTVDLMALVYFYAATSFIVV
jgi:hypothetical protein